MQSPRNQLQGIGLLLTSSANWNKRDKLKKLVRIHFSSDVFSAFAVVGAKAPTEIKSCVKVMQLHRIRRVKRYTRQDRLYWKISALIFLLL